MVDALLAFATSNNISLTVRSMVETKNLLGDISRWASNLDKTYSLWSDSSDADAASGVKLRLCGNNATLGWRRCGQMLISERRQGLPRCSKAYRKSGLRLLHRNRSKSSSPGMEIGSANFKTNVPLGCVLLIDD